MRTTNRTLPQLALVAVLAACAAPRLPRGGTARATRFIDPADPALLTVAETSGFRATSRHADVLAVLDRLAAGSDRAVRGTLGASFEGREIPLLIIADPPVSSAREARASGKLVLFAFGNIHAGEVCGKEALLMWARQLLAAEPGPLERDVLGGAVVVLAPIYNCDGNEKIAKDNRPGQAGPEEGMGRRENGQGLDLNRDYMKLETPEAQAHVRFLTEWDPDVVIDTHTTNGSVHRYTLTYDTALNPTAHPAPIAYVRERLLPEATHRLAARTGYRTFFYGNFDEAETVWATYSSQPRFGCAYRGLRHHLAILTEAYSYASFAERVRSTFEFVRECAAIAARDRDLIRALRRTARDETITCGRDGAGPLGFRHAYAADAGQAHVLSALDDGTPATFAVRHFAGFQPAISIARPCAYLIPPGLEPVLDKLRQHGVEVEKVAAKARVTVEVHRVLGIARSRRPFQGHREVTLTVEPRQDQVGIGPGWSRVSLAQPLGTLAAYLLESQSDDGLVTWNVLDPWLAEGRDYPILREPPPDRP